MDMTQDFADKVTRGIEVMNAGTDDAYRRYLGIPAPDDRRIDAARVLAKFALLLECGAATIMDDYETRLTDLDAAHGVIAINAEATRRVRYTAKI
jgi:hypothetical protein